MVSAVHGFLRFLIVAGYVIVGLGAVMGALLVLLSPRKSPFGKALRWLWRRVVVQPVSSWFRGEVGHVIDDKLLKRNGGTTVPDAIRKVEELKATVEELHTTVLDLHGQNTERLDHIETELATVPKQ